MWTGLRSWWGDQIRASVPYPGIRTLAWESAQSRVCTHTFKLKNGVENT